MTLTTNYLNFRYSTNEAKILNASNYSEAMLILIQYSLECFYFISGTYEMIYGLRKYFLGETNTPKLPEAFSSNSTGPNPLDILALSIIDEDVLFPILLHAAAFEYGVSWCI